MKQGWLQALGLVVVVIVLRGLPAVQEFADLIDDQRPWLLPLTMSMSILGFLARPRRDRPLPEATADP